MTTVITKTKYFTCRRIFGIAIFALFILFNISCIKPNGQSQPHENLPIVIPIRVNKPNVKKGIILNVKKCSKVPIGQEKTAAGQA